MHCIRSFHTNKGPHGTVVKDYALIWQAGCTGKNACRQVSSLSHAQSWVYLCYMGLLGKILTCGSQVLVSLQEVKSYLRKVLTFCITLQVLYPDGVIDIAVFYCEVLRWHEMWIMMLKKHLASKHQCMKASPDLVQMVSIKRYITFLRNFVRHFFLIFGVS